MSSTATTTNAPTRRSITCPVTLNPEERSGGQLKLSGLAAPYGRESLDIGFREIIEPGAFRASLSGTRDVLLLWQHDSAQPLARQSAGNLDVNETTRGVEFSATLPATSTARDAVELVRAGVVTEMSFGFTVAKDRWEQRDGERVRIVERANLFELSLVTEAAYGSATSVAARNRELAQRIEATVGRMRRPSATPDPYQPGGPHSYFRDKLTIAIDQQRRDGLVLSGLSRDVAPGALTFGGHPVHGGYQEAVL